MSSIKRVMEYSRLNYFEVLNLPCDVFKLMGRNSLIDEYSQSEEGRKILEEWRNYRKQEPDMVNINNLIKNMKRGE